MAVGHPPFNDANENDKVYNYMTNGEYDLFWEVHLGKGKRSKPLDKSLKDLILRMLNLTQNKINCAASVSAQLDAIATNNQI